MPRRVIFWAVVLFLAVLGLVFLPALRADDTLDDRLYWYRCDNVRVVDGDTVECNPLQLGLDVSIDESVLRLAGLNAPEVTGPEKSDGLVSKAWLADRIDGRDILIRTDKDDRGRYGRYIATLYDGDVNLNAELIRLGLAEARTY